MPELVTEIESRNDLPEILKKSPGKVIIKLGAEWCKPCKLIDDDVDEFFEKVGSTIQCAKIDVDDSFDLYAFLKRKKIVAAIPAVLYYKKPNVDYVPDDIVIGADKTELYAFFDRCNQN